MIPADGKYKSPLTAKLMRPANPRIEPKKVAAAILKSRSVPRPKPSNRSRTSDRGERLLENWALNISLVSR